MLDLINVMIEASMISWGWYIGLWETLFDQAFKVVTWLVGLL